MLPRAPVCVHVQDPPEAKADGLDALHVEGNEARSRSTSAHRRRVLLQEGGVRPSQSEVPDPVLEPRGSGLGLAVQGLGADGARLQSGQARWVWALVLV